MSGSLLFHECNRLLQDAFGSRAIADRLEDATMHTRFTEGDRAFIESSIYFFLATADAEGRPDVSFKGGPAGFVRVTGPTEIAFPDYDGNGMFKSLGNLGVNANVGCSLLPCMAARGGSASVAQHVCRETINCLLKLSGRS